VKQTANPLYLQALLEELRLYGDHYTFSQRIEHFLSAATVDELYEKVLERYEEDYERDRPGLVQDAMSLLWAARRGLSEAELLELLGTGGEPLPRAHWSPLYLAAEQSLVSRSGLVGFFHDYLRQAVSDRYLPSEGAQQVAHLRLADYFETRDLGVRKVDELPWQLAQAQAWPRLHTLLADLPFFTTAWNTDEYEVKAYWAQLEGNSSLRMVDAYRAAVDAPERQQATTVFHVSKLLADTGHPSEALILRQHLTERFRESGDRANLQTSLAGQGVILQARGDLDGAMALYREQERLCRELGDKDGLQTSLAGQGVILRARGDLDGAMALYREQERLCRELGDKDGLQTSLAGQGVILQARGDLDGAMSLHKEKERICRELGSKAGLQASLGNQALILRARGDLDGAMALLKEEERLCRELGNKEGLAISLANQASVLASGMGRPREALPLAEEAYRLATQHGFAAVARQIQPFLEALRSQAR
jgi:tetratricopeptide (TPR) repeat protein